MVQIISKANSSIFGMLESMFSSVTVISVNVASKDKILNRRNYASVGYKDLRMVEMRKNTLVALRKVV